MWKIIDTFLRLLDDAGMIHRVERLFPLLLALILLGLASGARAQTIYWDSDTGFNPSSGVVNPGTTVYFVNIDPYGFDVTVFIGALQFTLAQYDSQGVVFGSGGVYNFSSNYGDYGSVTVNLPPTVNITSPTNNMAFTAPASFTFSATASDPDGDGVAGVQFFAGTNLVGEVTSPPYRTNVLNLAAGAYTLTAIATDSYGAQATNTIQITVNAVIRLASPRLVGGQFLFDVTGLTPGKTNVQQSATSLTGWTSFSTNVAAGGTATFTNPLVPPRRFFRLLQLP